MTHNKNLELQFDWSFSFMWPTILVDKTSSNVKIKESSLKGLPLHFKNQNRKD